MLFLFNLLPAFPMDGGRLLRSLLAMRLSRERATRIAALLGRFFGFAFIAYGLFDGQPFMALIGVFVIMAASGEERMVRTQSVLQGKPVALAMRTLFWRMERHATVAEAAAALLAGGDKDLIVTDGDAFLGTPPCRRYPAGHGTGKAAHPFVGALTTDRASSGTDR